MSSLAAWLSLRLDVCFYACRRLQALVSCGSDEDY